MLIAIISLGRLSEQEKDLEILILRQQLAILQRKQDKLVKPNRAEKMTLAILTAKLKDVTQRSASRLRDIIRIFQPETVLGWHRQLVRRKWTYARKNKGGRSRINQELENLILRLTRENPRWGYGKIEGELLKLGFQISRTTIRNVLDRHNIEPTPVRHGSIGWRHLMTHYKEQILACDFFTVETIRLQTIYVLFFIELGSRQVHLAGVTAHPNDIWVTQQARQIVWELDDRELPTVSPALSGMHFLIRDNDRKFSRSFDTVFRSAGLRVISTPFQAPNANAFAERWVRTIREECLDHILILSETHLRRVLDEFIDDYYNVARPHQGIEQRIPIPHGQPQNTGSIQRRKVLGGIVNDYYRNPVVSSSYSIH